MFNVNQETEGFFQFESSLMYLLARSSSFEYICYGSTTIRTISTLSGRGSSLDVRMYKAILVVNIAYIHVTVLLLYYFYGAICVRICYILKQ